MSKFLLDTTALIDFSKGRQPAKSRILEMIESGDDVGICAINTAEFFAGLPPEKRKAWEEFFSTLLYWDISPEIAMNAGCLRYDFRKKGKSLTTTDTIIASVAIQEEAVLVTNNVKDYPMKGITLLSLENIRS